MTKDEKKAYQSCDKWWHDPDDIRSTIGPKTIYKKGWADGIVDKNKTITSQSATISGLRKAVEKLSEVFTVESRGVSNKEMSNILGVEMCRRIRIALHALEDFPEPSEGGE